MYLPQTKAGSTCGLVCEKEEGTRCGRQMPEAWGKDSEKSAEGRNMVATRKACLSFDQLPVNLAKVPLAGTYKQVSLDFWHLS